MNVIQNAEKSLFLTQPYGKDRLVAGSVPVPYVCGFSPCLVEFSFEKSQQEKNSQDNALIFVITQHPKEVFRTPRSYAHQALTCMQ